MLDAIERARLFVGNMDSATLAADEKSPYATVRAIEILGEAAKRILADIREQEPALPWGDIAGMRDLVIHAYHRVDADVVWRTVREALPSIEPMIVRALRRQRDAEEASG